jgi:hypothetical protein
VGRVTDYAEVIPVKTIWAITSGLPTNCPESPGPTFIEVIIAQFYASDFWTATLPELLATYKTKRWFAS